MSPSPRGRRSLPGFRVTLGFTLAYLGLVVVVPLLALVLKTATMPPAAFLAIVTSPRVLASCRLSLGAALVAASVNGVFGLLLAWVLVRYTFPLRRVADALVDLPLALPTAVAGIVLATLYAPGGWLGRPLAALGLPVAFTPLGIVVRTVQPVLEGLEPDVEEAAASLGAGRWQTFRRVLLPTVLPAWITGLALAFARAVGEYGSVVFIAGNMPMKTEIAPLLIVGKLDQYDYAGSTAIALILLVASVLLLLAINGLQRWSSRRGVAA